MRESQSALHEHRLSARAAASIPTIADAMIRTGAYGVPVLSIRPTHLPATDQQAQNSVHPGGGLSRIHGFEEY